MSQLEEGLKKALQRAEPPEGFAERVLARVASEERVKKTVPRTWFAWLGASSMRWAAASALCVFLATSGLLYHREQTRKGEEAKEQLMLALRITGAKLEVAAESVRSLNAGEPER